MNQLLSSRRSSPARRRSSRREASVPSRGAGSDFSGAFGFGAGGWLTVFGRGARRGLPAGGARWAVCAGAAG